MTQSTFLDFFSFSSHLSVQNAAHSTYSSASNNRKLFGSPGSTQKKNDESREEQHRRYEISRPPRQFQQSWTDKCKCWSSDLTKMHMVGPEVCKEVGGKGSFVDGCTNFKVSSVKVHDTCLPHVMNTRKAEAKRNPEKDSRTQNAGKSELGLFRLTSLKNLFRTAHGIAKHGRPLTDFS